MNRAVVPAGPVQILAVASVVVLQAATSGRAQSATTWWPSRGAVILEGGDIGPATFGTVSARLITLAGGPSSHIVIIPTANEAVAPRLRGSGPDFDPDQLKKLLETKGAERITILHTRDRNVANSASFAEVLRTASGVWIPGGGARILENTYRGTLVAEELKALLARGGVVAGDSAGAIALGCSMLGWTPDSWGVVVEGLSILPRATVVPHANAARGYVPADETLKYLVEHPGPVGIVIDEDTALILNGSIAETVGAGAVTLVDPAKDKARPYLVLKAGDKRDLAR